MDLSEYLKENIPLLVVFLLILVLIAVLLVLLILQIVRQKKHPEEKIERKDEISEPQQEPLSEAPIKGPEPEEEPEKEPEEEPEEEQKAEEEPEEKPEAEEEPEEKPEAETEPEKESEEEPENKPESEGKEQIEPETEAKQEDDMKKEEKPIAAKASGGKWVIFEEERGGFGFRLLASNGELMLKSSSPYSTLSSAKSGIKTYQDNIAADRLEIVETKKGNFFVQVNNASNRLLATSADYKTKQSAESAMESIKRWAATTSVLVEQEETE